jgi:hypothetical protein
VDLVSAKIQFGRENEISRRDPESGGPAGLLEDFVALGVADFKGDDLIGERSFCAAVEDQAADVDRLARLINRLLGSEQDSGGVLYFHLLGDLVPAKGR